MTVLTIRRLEKAEQNKVWFTSIDLELQPGEAKAIHCERDIGTYVLSILIGQTAATNGEIDYFGQSFNGEWAKVRNRMGVVFLDDPPYERLTPSAYLQFFQRLYGKEADVTELLRQVHLLDKQKVKIKKLSYSEKRRLAFAKAIVHDPELVILEEPDQNIDLESKRILSKWIRSLVEANRSVLVITSNLESAISMTDYVYRLNENGLKLVEVIDGRNQTQNETSVDPTDVTRPFQMERIPAKVNEKMILFDPTEIDYIESHEGFANLHVKGQVFLCTMTLNELDGRLKPFGFFRCHRSYLVNLQKVREVMTWSRNSYSLILDTAQHDSIPLSKGRLAELKQLIGIS